MLTVHHGPPPVCLRLTCFDLIETCSGYSHVSAIQTKLLGRKLHAFGCQPRKTEFMFHERASTK
jgi:hypothetical protein